MRGQERDALNFEGCDRSRHTKRSAIGSDHMINLSMSESDSSVGRKRCGHEHFSSHYGDNTGTSCLLNELLHI